MHTLLSILAILKSTEPDFSVIAEDTVVDAPGFLDITLYLLLKMAKEEQFSDKALKPSATLHATFLKLLMLLNQCLADDRFSSKLIVTEASSTYDM